jgi:hypothetical protein
MKPPPVQPATTLATPVKRSSATMTLLPAESALPRLADQETMVWVTSWGLDEPVNEQILRGLRGSDTSARIGLDDPCITSSASWVAGPPVQLACMAAHEGTPSGVADGLGEGLGLGDGLGEGEGEGLGLGLGDGLAWVTAGPLGVHPAIASTMATRQRPLLTWA